MTALLIHFFIFSSAVVATHGCTTGACGCSTPPRLESDQLSLLQHKRKVVHERARGETTIELVPDAGLGIEERQASKIRAVQIQYVDRLPAFYALLAHWDSGIGTRHYVKFLLGVFVACLLMKFWPRTVLLNIIFASVYVVWSSALLLVNSSLIQNMRVEPVVLVTLHMFISSFLICGLSYMLPQYFIGLADIQNGSSDECSELYCGVGVTVGCFVMSLVLENLAYAEASVAFVQVTKETGLVVVVAFALAMGIDSFSRKRFGLLSLVVAGACMCVRGDMHLTLWGPALQMISNFCNGARLAMQNKVLVRASGIKLDPLSYMALVSPISFATLFLPALTLLVIQQEMLVAIRSSIGMISLSCALAVGLNLLVAVLVQRISAIGFALLGALRNALIIVFSCLASGVETSAFQMFGCALVVSCSFFYAVIVQWDDQPLTKKDILQNQLLDEPKGRGPF